MSLVFWSSLSIAYLWAHISTNLRFSIRNILCSTPRRSLPISPDISEKKIQAYHQYSVGSRPKGALYSQPQVIKITDCLPMVGGSLRVLPASSSTKTWYAEILLKVELKHQTSIKINYLLSPDNNKMVSK